MTNLSTVDFPIRQLHARFIDAVWRKDAEAFGQCFSRDGEWKIAGMHLRGREEVAETFARLLAACQRVQITSGAPLLDIVQGEVVARSNVTELAKMSDGSGAITLGVYFDHYVEEEGAWRFAWRHWALHYRGPFDLAAEFVDCPDYGPPPGLPGSDEPTFSRRNPAA